MLYAFVFSTTTSSKDEALPFPWQLQPSEPAKLSNNNRGTSQEKRDCPDGAHPLVVDNKRKRDTNVYDSPRLKALQTQCQTLGCIVLKLCDLNAVAGVVLRHAIGVLENLFRREEPLTFKIGFTHDPVWRWSNNRYGYQYARERWEAMIVLYYSKEPYSAAMLEASLIEKFQSTCAALAKPTSVFPKNISAG